MAPGGPPRHRGREGDGELASGMRRRLGEDAPAVGDGTATATLASGRRRQLREDAPVFGDRMAMATLASGRRRRTRENVRSAGEGAVC